jgi:hypothetical protein
MREEMGRRLRGQTPFCILQAMDEAADYAVDYVDHIELHL